MVHRAFAWQLPGRLDGMLAMRDPVWSWGGSVWESGQAGPTFVAVRFTQKEVEFKEDIAAH